MQDVVGIGRLARRRLRGPGREAEHRVGAVGFSIRIRAPHGGDAASAQYGSDAIAGVMNFVLANDRSGGALEIKTGGHSLSRTGTRFEGGRVPGDCEMYNVAGNAGLPVRENGFLNLTGEYGGSNPTDRSVQRNDALALIRDEGNRHVRDPVQIWGFPEVSDELKLWANAGYLFSDAASFYGYGNYARKQVEGSFYFRHPKVRSGVFGTSNAEGESILLVGDMLDARDGVLDGSANCPEVRVRGGLVIDDDAWNRVLGDPNCFTFQKIFPGGFTPQFGAYLLDASAVAGLKGARGWLAWDASASWGKSSLDFYIYNTVNASLGPDQQCSDRGASVVVPDQPCTPYFRPGVNDQQKVDFNVDASWTLNERVNLAAGAEWRNERFEIFRGDETSWTEGSARGAGLQPRIQRVSGLRSPRRGRVEPQQLRGLRRPRTAGSGGRVDVRRRRARRALLGLRRHGQRKGRRSREGCRGAGSSRQREHGLPRADGGPAERLQHLVDLRSRGRRHRPRRHHSHSLDVAARSAVRGRVARAREVGEHGARRRARAGPLQPLRRPLSSRRVRPPDSQRRPAAHPPADRRTRPRGHRSPGRRPRPVPLLHQRLLHAYPGDRPRGRLPGRRERRVRHPRRQRLELDFDLGDGVQRSDPDGDAYPHSGGGVAERARQRRRESRVPHGTADPRSSKLLGRLLRRRNALLRERPRSHDRLPRPASSSTSKALTRRPRTGP